MGTSCTCDADDPCDACWLETASREELLGAVVHEIRKFTDDQLRELLREVV